MYTGKDWGFTLIELLVVIAIIGILAAMLAVGYPKAMEMARLSDVETDFNALRNSLSVYAADHGSYPPRYGYYTGYKDATGTDLFFLTPYLAKIGEFRNMGLYDRFSFTDDANQDGVVDRLEYTPEGIQTGPDNYLFPEDPAHPDYVPPYIGIPPLPPSNEQAPFIYVPVNRRQADQYAQWFFKKWKATGNVKYMYAIDDGAGPGNNPIEDYGMTFPPPQYDDYVLISVGPAGITSNAPAVNPLVQYHVDALRAYFLATRDANDNGELDFDYRARKQGEGTRAAYDQDGLYHLPSEFAAWQSTGFPGSGPGCLIGRP
jgi:prepilin-type N-terminal cleavage/methylation domain-containing protein